MVVVVVVLSVAILVDFRRCFHLSVAILVDFRHQSSHFLSSHFYLSKMQAFNLDVCAFRIVPVLQYRNRLELQEMIKVSVWM
jgi:hypothetical protein